MKSVALLAVCCAGANAFVPSPVARGPSGVKNAPSSSATSNTVMMAKSASMPFLDAPAALDGTMVGDVGFDPLGLSENINLPYGESCLSLLGLPDSCAEGVSCSLVRSLVRCPPLQGSTHPAAVFCRHWSQGSNKKTTQKHQDPFLCSGMETLGAEHEVTLRFEVIEVPSSTYRRASPCWHFV